MARRGGPLALACLLALACGRGGGGAEEAGETRTALGTAEGVARADSAGSDAHRVVPLRPMTGDVEILYGDPGKPGPFVMRIRELPGTIVPVHSHPVDEHITVVQGTWHFAVGEEWDRAALREMGPGTYAFAPRGSRMFAYSPEGAVVQVHGVGPFHLHWKDGMVTLDDPGGPASFRLRKGQQVRSPRGAGVIRQGYRSGDIIQYEIEGAGGGRFMAVESDVQAT